MDDIELIKTEETNNKYYIYGERKDNRENYYCCNKKMHIHEYINPTIREVNNRVFIKIRKQRYKCSKCKKIITSELSIVDKHCKVAKNLKYEIT